MPSMDNPIPTGLLPKFVALMAARDDSDITDGEVWFFLEETAERFMSEHGLSGEPNAAVCQYFGEKSRS